jgi:hypothetical protein
MTQGGYSLYLFASDIQCLILAATRDICSASASFDLNPVLFTLPNRPLLPEGLCAPRQKSVVGLLTQRGNPARR